MATRWVEVPRPFLGQVDPETGRRRCCFCGVAVQGRRRDWCGDDCVLSYKLAQGDQRAARRFLWKKERGVCRRCRTDVNAYRRELERTHGYVPVVERDRCKWEADHRKPLVEGGGRTRENLRTLCRRCHKVVTRALRQRMLPFIRVAVP